MPIPLHVYAHDAFDLLLHEAKELTEDTLKKVTEDVATLCGHYAYKLGMSDEDITKWLQSNYGAIFVRRTLLRPPFSLKELGKLMIKARQSKAKLIN